MYTILLIATTLVQSTIAAPLETPGHERRGIAYNDANLVKYFDIAGSHVTW